MNSFFQTNQSGQIIFWSDPAEKILGWSANEAQNLSIKKLDPKPAFPDILDKDLSQSIRLTSKTGVEIIFVGNIDQDGNWFVHPATEPRTGLTHIKQIESSHDGLIGVDRDLQITSWNRAAEAIYQTSEEESVDSSVTQFFPESVIQEIRTAIKDNSSIQELEYRTNGDRFIANISATEDAGGKAIRAVIAVRDISDRDQFAEEINYLHTHHQETGLINRGEFIRQINERIGDDDQPTVAIFNVDNFKLINDNQGHTQGDHLIQAIGEVIAQETAEASDLLPAYFGADEFAIFSIDNNEKTVAELARKIVDLIEAKSTSIVALPITVSVGISEDREFDSAEDIIVSADSALFEAKSQNEAKIYTHAADETVSIKLIEQLQTALQEDRLQLYQQPIQNIRSGQVERYELLLRIEEGGEMKAPGPFLVAAEQMQLTEEIDLFVARRGIEVAAEGKVVEINLSGHALHNERIIQAISDQLHSSYCDPSNVIFEITETSAVASFDQARQLIYGLTELGCKFMLDDFGTGFGSFSYLKHLPISGIKIDGDFVRNIVQSEIDQRIVAAIVMISEALEKETVAEWVEDQETLDILADLGIEYAQGYLIGKPVPIG